MIANAIHFQLDLPYGRPPKSLWGNARDSHWSGRSNAARQLRSDVVFLARRAQIPVSTHLDVLLTWAPGDNRRRDADNLWPFLKSCCDGLSRGKRADWVGLDLVPDDTPQWMTKHAPVILNRDQCPATGMWLDIWAQPVAVELP